LRRVAAACESDADGPEAGAVSAAGDSQGPKGPTTREPACGRLSTVARREMARRPQ